MSDFEDCDQPLCSSAKGIKLCHSTDESSNSSDRESTGQWKLNLDSFPPIDVIVQEHHNACLINNDI